MKYCEFIKKGDTIGVPAPSSGAYNDLKFNKFNNAKKRLESLGYKIKLSNNINVSYMGRSASAIDRASEINEMFKNKDINSIICACGGDFLIEILPYIDFDLIKNNPKLIAGFSDPTGLLYPITTKLDIATIYGQNFSSLGSLNLHKSQEDFLEIVSGNIINQTNYDLYEDKSYESVTGLEDFNLTEKVLWKTLDNKDVSISGRIIGGCLDIITEIAGTKYDGINEFNEKYKDDGIIWYFDNCELSMEDTIRTLWKLNEFDYFKYTKGIIFGRFGHLDTIYGYDVLSCLKDSVLNNLNIPIIYDADISHKSPCLTIINGSIANVELKNSSAKISFELR